jgi:hypothetical protein
LRNLFGATAPNTYILLHGTASEVKTLTFTFKLSSWSSHRYEFRTYWNGGADFELHNIVLKTDSR